MATSDLTTYISLFHSPERGEEALRALETAGFNRSSITSTWKNNTGSGSSDYTSELTSIGVPDRDMKRLQKGIEDGGVVISLQAPESRTDEIERIFHKFTADKIDDAEINRGGDYAAGAYVPPVAPVANTGKVLAAEGTVVPVVEEDLIVGKREVDRGGVRVFRRVVEEPVSESVSLHKEQVVVDRRPVDRAVTDADFASAGKTIELTETDEVAVVGKTARVVEEVRVGKVESDRTETVTDTVRHTEVEVEQVAGDTTRAAGTVPTTTKSGQKY